MSNPNGSVWEDAFKPPAPPLQDNPEFYAFAPKVKAPTVNTTATAVPAAVGKTGVQVWEAVLEYNNGLANFKPVSGPIEQWVDNVKGVIIHKITEADAQLVAATVKAQAPKFELPYLFTLGCLAIESTLDPKCQNGNLGPGESNTANAPGGYDMGVAQLKLKYLVPKPCATVDEARAFALDPAQAIAYHCSLMAGHLLWAQNIIEQNTSSAPDSRFSGASGALLLATGAYNFGQTGMLTYYENGTFPSHCQQVSDLTAYFATKTGQANPLAA